MKSKTGLYLGLFAFPVFFFLGAVQNVEPFHTHLYLFSWIPFLWVVDQTLFLKTQKSWIRQGAPFVRLCFFSTTLWLTFELFNFRLQNWSYIGLPDSQWIRWPGYALSFATVVPGVLITRDLVATKLQSNNDEYFDQQKSNPIFLVFIGILMLLLPLLFPRFAFPLIWGFAFFLFEPLVQKWGGHSLLMDWKNQRWATTSSLLIAGLICGFFWEMCNFGAGAKWIYHIPFVGFLKVFEMPLLGFIGFPVFALEVYVLYQCAILGWAKLSKTIQWILISACLLFWVGVFIGIDSITAYFP